MYTYVLFIHIIAAIVGLGAAFAFPIIAKSAKTVSQATYMLSLLKRLEIMPKIGGILLLVTGLVLAILEPSLFTTGWYIASIIIYIVIQVIVIGFLPKLMEKQAECLQHQQTDELPSTYTSIAKQSSKLEGYVHLMTLILIILMVFKPF